MRNKALFPALVELTKPRVTLMVVITAAAGFYLGADGPIDLARLLNCMIGTGMMAGGTAVLNQYMERKADAKMRRTLDRPLPAGIITPRLALFYGMALVFVGMFQLFLANNPLTAFLGWLTSAVYLLCYTPLKTRSHLCTAVGAIPGAAPPIMGWAAAAGTLDMNALLLFAILFSWQFPHFLAIAWIYREDYERGGFIMLPERDSDGIITSRQILAFSVLLLLLSIAPYFTGLTGAIYAIGAVPLGLLFLWAGVKLAKGRTKTAARLLLRTSVIYLPLLLILMTADKF